MSHPIALEMLKRHEGYRQKPYHCTAGKLTVGYGRNLDDVGLTVDEAEYLLKGDINRAVLSLQLMPCWLTLDSVRRAVLINMHVNLGNAGLNKFKKFLAAVERADYDAAADEMQASMWYRQVRIRAAELVQMMRTGQTKA